MYKAGLQSLQDLPALEFLGVMSISGRSPVWKQADDSPGSPDPETRSALEKAFSGGGLPPACLADVARALTLTPVAEFGDRQLRLTRIVAHRGWRYFQAAVRIGPSFRVAGVAVRAVGAGWVVESIQYLSFS